MSINKDYGVHKLNSADKKMPFHNGVVFATNQGWCVSNKEMHNDTEVVVENRGLKDRLKAAGYNEYGVAVEGNPCGDLPRPRYVAQCIAKQMGTQQPTIDVVETVVKTVTYETMPSLVNPVADLPEGYVVQEAPQAQEEHAAEVVVEVVDETAPVAEVADEAPVKYNKKQLMGMHMDDVRVIGKTFDVADISKEKLVKKILKAQG